MCSSTASQGGGQREGEGASSKPTDQHKMRPLCLALIESDVRENEDVQIEIRGRAVDAVVVSRHLRSDTAPYARPIVR